VFSESDSSFVIVVQDSVPLAVSRQVVTDFAESMSKLAKDVIIAVGQHALKALHGHITSFEEHYSTISEKLAGVYRDDGKFRLAADLLAGIPLDSGQRYVVLFCLIDLFVEFLIILCVWVVSSTKSTVQAFTFKLPSRICRIPPGRRPTKQSTALPVSRRMHR
jgi:hypothetical protein